MTREELIAKIQDIEWDDFEAKEALNELPCRLLFSDASYCTRV